MNTPRPRGSVLSYTTGFVLSLIATLAAYGLVVGHVASATIVLAAVGALALVQLIVQLVLFLHLGRHAPEWNRSAFAFTLIILGILVIGSLWIMYSLNSRMMLSPAQMEQYMGSQSDGL